MIKFIKKILLIFGVLLVFMCSSCKKLTGVIFPGLVGKWKFYEVYADDNEDKTDGIISQYLVPFAHRDVVIFEFFNDDLLEINGEIYKGANLKIYEKKIREFDTTKINFNNLKLNMDLTVDSKDTIYVMSVKWRIEDGIVYISKNYEQDKNEETSFLSIDGDKIKITSRSKNQEQKYINEYLLFEKVK